MFALLALAALFAPPGPAGAPGALALSIPVRAVALSANNWHRLMLYSGYATGVLP